jgi:hypothetical protein
MWKGPNNLGQELEYYRNFLYALLISRTVVALINIYAWRLFQYQLWKLGWFWTVFSEAEQISKNV